MHSTTTQTKSSTTDIRSLLLAEHGRLDDLFRDVLAAFHADARDEAARLWNRFAEGLEAHMNVEETLILPELERVAPKEASAIRTEHREIRRRLLELGVGVDLHLTNDVAVEDFIRELKAHAAHEDQLAYQWASTSLPVERRNEIAARVNVGTRTPAATPR